MFMTRKGSQKICLKRAKKRSLRGIKTLTKKYIKFYLIGFVLLVLPYYMAFAGDTFSVAVVSLPALLFFISHFILSAVRLLGKKGVKINVVKSMSSVILIVSLGIPLNLSDQGLRELTQKRIQIINELKPVFVKYYSENGCFPKSLEDLVPNYIKAIPEELINDGKKDPYKRIYYELTGGEPKFYFRTIRGPDSSASLNVVSGEYWHDT